MKIFTDFKMTVDPDEVRSLLDKIKANLPSTGDKKLLKKIFSLIDLTSPERKRQY